MYVCMYAQCYRIEAVMKVIDVMAMVIDIAIGLKLYGI